MPLPSKVLAPWQDVIEQRARDSHAMGIALFSEQGDVLFANPAIRRFLGDQGADSLTHPTFTELMWLSESRRDAGEAPVFTGFITAASDDGGKSIHANVYRKNRELLIVGELDVEEISRQFFSLAELYRENSQLQRELIRQKQRLDDEVADRKRSESQVRALLKEKEVVLKEVHHRIKNDMNSVISFLWIQSSMEANSAAKTAMENAIQRIKSMMVLYEQLYQSPNVDEMELSEYLVPLVRHILENYSGTNEIELRIDVPPVALRPKTLSVIGMIINELVTNAMKYGFVEHPRPVLSISVQQQSSVLLISVQDNGPGIPDSFDPSSPTGFGVEMTSFLTEQIGGTITFEKRAGTLVTLELPVTDLP